MMMMVMTLGLVSLLPAVGPSLSLDLLLDASALTDLRKILDTTGKSKKSLPLEGLPAFNRTVSMTSQAGAPPIAASSCLFGENKDGKKEMMLMMMIMMAVMMTLKRTFLQSRRCRECCLSVPTHRGFVPGNSHPRLQEVDINYNQLYLLYNNVII